MKRYVTIFSLIILISLVLWMSVPAQQQLHEQTGTNLKVTTQKIDTLQLRIRKMEKELAALRKVIKIKGANVEIKSQGTLKLNAATTLSLNSKSELNIKGITLNLNSSNMTLKGDALITLKGGLIKLN